MTQAHVDAFYAKHGPCCAGCDYWRWINTAVGECVRHAPDPLHDAAGGLNIEGWSGPPSSTMLTKRNQWCGDFRGRSMTRTAIETGSVGMSEGEAGGNAPKQSCIFACCNDPDCNCDHEARAGTSLRKMQRTPAAPSINQQSGKADQ